MQKSWTSSKTIGGPSQALETCATCDKQIYVYRRGSFDWEQEQCTDCSFESKKIDWEALKKELA